MNLPEPPRPRWKEKALESWAAAKNPRQKAALLNQLLLEAGSLHTSAKGLFTGGYDRISAAARSVRHQEMETRATEMDQLAEVWGQELLQSNMVSRVHKEIVQTFAFAWADGDVIVWNIPLAQKLIAQRWMEEVTADFSILTAITAQSEGLDPEDVARADLSIPGIAAPHLEPETGQHGFVLIDGQHRAFKALMLHTPWMIRCLNILDNRACIIECSNWARVP